MMPPDQAQVFLHIFTPFGFGNGGGIIPYDPATGRFEATGLDDGVYAIGVDLAGPSSKADRTFVGYPRDAWEQIEISGADRDDIVIRVPRSGYIHGRITLEGDRALSEAYAAKIPSSRTGQPFESSVPIGPRVGLQQTTSLQPQPYSNYPNAD